jgi:hypothetical protein
VIVRRWSICAGLVGCVACSGVIGPTVAPGACRQTSEFGNYGCILITGTVIGLRGQLLSGAYISLGERVDGGQFGGGFDTTDATGRYAIRRIRVLADRTPSDSVTLWVRGVRALTSAGLAGPYYRDSSRVRVRVTPIGAIPAATVVDLTLPEP